MNVKTALTILSTMLIVSGCTTTKIVKETQFTHLPVSNVIYTTCKKPTSLESDFKVGDMKELKDLSESEIDKRTIAALAKIKGEHIACYKTVLNIKKTIDESNSILNGGTK